MCGLATPFADLALSAEHAVHSWHGAQVAAFIQQVGVDAGGCLVNEALVMQHAQDRGSFSLTECPRLWHAGSGRSGWKRALSMAPIVGRSSAAQRGARGSLADH